MKNGILVLGASAINTHSFAAQLTGHPIAPDESVVPWTLQTKYYIANVRLWLDTLDDTSDVTAVVESLGDAVDGLVLLFDSEKPDTFEAVKPWKEFVSDAAVSCSLTLSMATMCIT
ncbi:hypothetical protein BCR33DRAFT_717064 [Rhizoclosmatium globosum]|uniref:Uncharacterized protein n=1 Tax=Rhizoclosmatium globosum TaxID=329046 RepID=A0A1Y2CC96_9FUNG|nr:hypothetical protein BCR33DRAFT_717064 [Rhizoclosmatium globosum]|eukprot:ORY44556.1 hypothetical protein BCR33DRAFT_717064 [Rhizoclosmatium globosum]